MLRRLFPAGTLIFIVLWAGLMIVGRQAMFRDPGTFWHVVVGRDILESRQVPRVDHFSFTRAGRSWVADQWLAEAAMAEVHRAAGFDGLLTLAAALLAVTLAIPTVRLLRAGLHWLPTMLLLGLVLLAGSHQFHVRPLLGSLLGTVAVYAGLLDLEAGRRGWPCAIGLVMLGWLWANLHGGVLGGIGMAILVLGGWSIVWLIGKSSYIGHLLRTARPMSEAAPRKAVGRPVSREIMSEKLALATTESITPGESPGANGTFTASRLLGGWLLLGIGLLLLFVNPYGVDLPKTWIETLWMPLPEIIQEHRSPAWNDPGVLGAYGLGILFATSLGGIPIRRWRVTWLIPPVWLVLGALRVRFLPLAALTTALALAETLPLSRWAGWLQGRGLLRHLAAAKRRESALPILIPVLLVSVVFCLQVSGVVLPIIGRGWTRFDPRIAPDDMLEAIDGITKDASDGGERIFNDLNFGGFLIYYAPRLKIFIDDRCLLYGTDFLQAYDQARRKSPETIGNWRRQYGFRYALVEAQGRFDDYLRRSGRWTALVRTPAAALYRCDLGKTPPKP